MHAIAMVLWQEATIAASPWLKQMAELIEVLFGYDVTIISI
jgi:hypothetical protein